MSSSLRIPATKTITFPDRFEWTGGKPAPPIPPLTIRECGPSDGRSVKALTGFSWRKLSLYFHDHSYSMWAAVRSQRHLGGLIATHHDVKKEINEIQWLYVSPCYRRKGYASKLLKYAFFEQPDWPITVSLGAEDYELQGFFHKQGFTKTPDSSTDSGGDSTWQFAYRPSDTKTDAAVEPRGTSP